jgi:hypothetical protein
VECSKTYRSHNGKEKFLFSGALKYCITKVRQKKKERKKRRNEGREQNGRGK